MADVAPVAEDVAATFCATLVDEWVRAGVRHAFVAPGSRSTPMALALAAEDRITLSVHHDERAAAFAALGAALASERPALVLTTSGTAAVETHAAVVEAHQAHVPMIVVTADRPPELRDVGAPQTVDQRDLFGRAVRWFVDPGVAEWTARATWRSLAARAVIEAGGTRPGPVHLNLPFREPLVGAPRTGPPGRPRGAPWHVAVAAASARGEAVLSRDAAGLVVAGRGARRHARAIAALGWPVLTDARAGIGGVAHADPLLRIAAFADDHRPEVVVRVGEPHASRVVNDWLDASGADQMFLGEGWIDPGHVARQVVGSLRTRAGGTSPRRGWRAAWTNADALAAQAIDAHVPARVITEPGVARAVMQAAPARGHVVLASSMPVRDVEWYTPRRVDLTVHANRGANGIDGVVSTAIGVATTGAPTVALVGDLAFLHDSSALSGLARRDLDLTVVVVDNDGGGIFSFLPQAERVPPDRFELLFGTPHGADCAAVARAHGITALEPTTPAATARAVAGGRGTRVVVVRTDRAENVEVHRRINAAVAEAWLRGAGSRRASPRA